MQLFTVLFSHKEGNIIFDVRVSKMQCPHILNKNPTHYEYSTKIRINEVAPGTWNLLKMVPLAPGRIYPPQYQ